MIYFAPKWRLYVMIWLPWTTDNSTYFAQSLEIRGIESRLYTYVFIIHATEYERLKIKIPVEGSYEFYLFFIPPLCLIFFI